MDGPFRLEPQGEPTDYKTFAIKVPANGFRSATCREVDCPQYLNGWKVRADVLSEGDIHLLTNCGRKFVWDRRAEFENWLVFEAGQPCFRESTHRTRNDRPELFLTKIGDYRVRAADTGGPFIHANAVDWTDDLHNHTDNLAQARKEG